MCTVPDGPPQNFNVAPINYTTVFLSWDRPVPTDENGIITTYTIIYNGSRVEEQLVSNMISCVFILMYHLQLNWLRSIRFNV